MGIYLHDVSNLWIDHREFPGSDEYPPGPLGYSNLIDFNPIEKFEYNMFPFNQWLADGLLVCSISSLDICMSNISRSSSCIDVTSFIPKVTGS